MTYRRSRGWAKGPCPGCGKGEQHPSNSVCHECKELMADGKAFRLETERRLKLTTGPSVWHWSEASYGWPRYYGDYDFAHDKKRDIQDTLNNAMYALVNAASEPAPPGTPDRSPIIDKEQTERHKGKGWGKSYVPWPYLLSYGKKNNNDNNWSFDCLVLMPAIVRDAIDALDQAIRAALTSAYLRGKQDGGSILLGLAKGNMTLDDYNDSLLTREERAEREKARRSY